MKIKDALKTIGRHKNELTRQQLKTLRGQVLAGNQEEAIKGLLRMIQSKPREV